MTTNTTINKQNKSELGMNRNDFYEYKKNRIVDLAKKGASVTEMAQDLGMGEKDMYAFLSRNFGGIRKLKEMANSGSPVPQLKMASMTTETEKRPVGRPKKSANTNNGNSGSVLFAFNNALSVIWSFLNRSNTVLLLTFCPYNSRISQTISSVNIALG